MKQTKFKWTIIGTCFWSLLIVASHVTVFKLGQNTEFNKLVAEQLVMDRPMPRVPEAKRVEMYDMVKKQFALSNDIDLNAQPQN